MTDLLRIIFLILGLFLIAIAVAAFFDIQAGDLARESIAYFSPRDGTNVEATATIADIGITLPAMTEVSNIGTATVGAALTQIAMSTSTVVPTSTALPGSSYYPPPPGPGDNFLVLGRHTVQDGEYLFCIGRAYGVLPEAIAKRNSFSMEAILFVGQELIIPDLPWENIPPGPTCRPQFKSPYTPAPTATLPPISSLIPVKSSAGNKESLSSGEFLSVNFVHLGAKANKTDLQTILNDNVPPLDTIAETRIVKVSLPTQMRLGGSSQVVLNFDPENGQPTVTVVGPSGETQVAATSTSEPGQSMYSSNPLVIPAVFDDYRVYAVARLYAAGFNYSPEDDVQQVVIVGNRLTWRWSVKPQDAEPQELIINLRLHFEAKTEGDFRADQVLWSDSFHVEVTKNLFASLFGAQASIFAGFSLITGSLVSIFSIWDKIKPGSKKQANQ